MAVTIKKSEDDKSEGPKKPSEITSIIAALKKSKGEKTILPGSSIPQVGRIPTGMFEFDLATGGGFPCGRISIVYGPESSGKTNCCYNAVANAQRLPAPNNVAVWVDMEGSFDPKWAARFGVDVDKLVVVKPGYGEEAVDMIEALVYAEECAILVVDSVAQLTPSKEIEDEASGQQPGRGALLVKKLCNKIAVALGIEAKRGHDPCVILINQTRFKIGVMYGDPETMPGGQTMKFLSSLTIRLYGKNKVVKEINPELPTYKDTNAVIKKAKVGIVQSSFTYEMALTEVDGLKVGETSSWNTVSNHLKQLGELSKVDKGGGWSIFGKTYPNLAPIQDLYLSDMKFRLKCQALIIDSMQSNVVLVGAAPEAV